MICRRCQDTGIYRDPQDVERRCACVVDPTSGKIVPLTPEQWRTLLDAAGLQHVPTPDGAVLTGVALTDEQIAAGLRELGWSIGRS